MLQKPGRITSGGGDSSVKTPLSEANHSTVGTDRGIGLLTKRFMEPMQFQLDLNHQPVLARDVQARQVMDSAQPLAEGVGVHVQRGGGGRDVAAAAQVLLERRQQL